MKLVITAVATASAVLCALSMASANPALLPSAALGANFRLDGTTNLNANSVVALTLGLQGIADVGNIYSTQVGGGFHGKGGARTQFDGMSVQSAQMP